MSGMLSAKTLNKAIPTTFRDNLNLILKFPLPLKKAECTRRFLDSRWNTTEWNLHLDNEPILHPTLHILLEQKEVFRNDNWNNYIIILVARKFKNF